MKRVIACALALCLTVCLFSVPAAAVSRDGIVKWTMPLATSVDLIEMTHAEETAGTGAEEPLAAERAYIRTQPHRPSDGDLWLDALRQKHHEQDAAYLEDENLSLVAGVNGSFFDMSTRHSLRLRCNGRRSSHERQRQLRRFQQKRRCYYRKSGRAHLCKRWPAQ